MDATRKREKPDSADGNDVDSKRRKETDSFQAVIRSEVKPCTRFFSTSGCPYGEDCQYLHHFPGGLQAVQQMAGRSNPAPVPPARNPFAPPPPLRNAAFGPVLKLRMCNKYNTSEGCKFGERCCFAHGRQELGKTVTFKMSVDASIVGIVIGKGGGNTKYISRLTGARLSIQDHESYLNLKNIQLEGTDDKINLARAMVRDLINNITARTTQLLPVRNPAPAARSNPKTKICDNFRIKGFCTYGDRCHFAHGESELQKGPPS